MRRASDTERLAALLGRLELPTASCRPGSSGEALLARMRLDKKAVSGAVRLILWSGLGQADVVHGVADADILPVLEP